MKNYLFLLLVVTIAAFAIPGCGSEDNSLNNPDGNNPGSQFNVRYEVLINSPGAVKIVHKSNSGTMLEQDPDSANWSQEYVFKDQVDALLDVEVSVVAPANSVSVQLAIFINGNRQQQSTATITSDRKSSISITYP